MSEISTAKDDLNSIMQSINAYLTLIMDAEDSDSLRFFPSKIATSYTNQIKSVIVKSNVSVDKVSSFVLSRFRGIILKFLKQLNAIELNDIKRERIGGLAFMLLDILFYVVCIDTRPRSTFILCQIVMKVINCKTIFDDSVLKEIVFKKIADEINTAIIKTPADRRFARIEFINLLYIQKQLGSEYIYPADRYSKVLDINHIVERNKLDYFSIISILGYCSNEPEYKELNKKVCGYVVKLFTEKKISIHNADAFCLVLDFVSCPYVDLPFKESAITAVFATFKGVKMTPSNRTEAINYISKREWFTSWKPVVSLESLLQKFELNFGY